MILLKKILLWIKNPEPQQPVADEPYDYPLWPALPKEVIYRAREGDAEWPFGGSLGPEHLLDLRLFRALTKARKDITSEDVEKFAHDMAHTAYDFYLDNLILENTSKEDNLKKQEAARDMWLELIK